MKRRIDGGRRHDSLQRRNNDDSLNPAVGHHLFRTDSSHGIRVEHSFDDRATLTGDEIGERRRRGGSGVHLKVGTEGGIGRLGDSPRELLEMHTVEDDCASPHVDQSRVVFCIESSDQQQSRSKREMDRPFCSNCSGAMYGSLPQSPLLKCVVFSQHIRKTSDTPKSVILT